MFKPTTSKTDLNYTVMSAYSSKSVGYALHDLKNAVNTKIAEGWQVAGGVSTVSYPLGTVNSKGEEMFNHTVCQALIKL